MNELLIGAIYRDVRDGELVMPVYEPVPLRPKHVHIVSLTCAEAYTLYIDDIEYRHYEKIADTLAEYCNLQVHDSLASTCSDSEPLVFDSWYEADDD